MRYLAAFLSMPNAGSWNGRWSGESRPYVSLIRVSEVNKAKMERQLSIIGSYYYDFGDGWGASVNIKEVTESEYKHYKKITAGFSGYDWMVSSIIKYKRIVNSTEKTFLDFKELAEKHLNHVELTDHNCYEELRFDNGRNKFSLRLYNQYNDHANEHMYLYVDGREYCKVTSASLSLMESLKHMADAA